MFRFCLSLYFYSLIYLTCIFLPIEAQEDKIKLFQNLLHETLTSLEFYQQAIDSTEFDLEKKALSFHQDISSIFSFVQEQIAFEPYEGLLKGASGCLNSGSGNSLDRSLLLLELLRRSGYKATLVLGKLSSSDAECLIRSRLETDEFISLKTMDLPYFIDEEKQKECRQSKLSKFRNHLQTRYDSLFNSLYPLCKDYLEKNPNISSLLEQAILQTQNHYWVRLYLDNQTVELDSSFPEFEFGKAVGTFLKEVEQPSPEVAHRITFIGFTSTLKENQVLEEELFRSSHKASELAGQSISFECPPTQASRKFIPKSPRIAILRLNDSILTQKEFIFEHPPQGSSREGLGGLGESLGGSLKEENLAKTEKCFTVAVGIRVILEGSGYTPQLITRYLVDLWGYGARSENDLKYLHSLKASPKIEEKLKQTTLYFAAETGQINPAQYQSQFLSHMMQIGKNIQIEKNRFSYKKPQAREYASSQLFAKVYFHYLDRFAQAQLEDRYYFTAPRLVMYLKDYSEKKYSIIFDATFQSVQFFSHQIQKAAFQQFQFGLISSIIEEELLFDAKKETYQPWLGSAKILQDSLRMASPLIISSISELPKVSRNASTYLKEQLNQEQILILSNTKKQPFLAWFTLNPKTGVLQAWTELGYHGAGAEDSLLRNQKSTETEVSAKPLADTTAKVLECSVNIISTTADMSINGVNLNNTSELAQSLMECASSIKASKVKKTPITEININDRIKKAGFKDNQDAKIFFGWGPKMNTKQASDFTREMLEERGLTKEMIESIADGYEQITKVTPKNPSAPIRSEQLNDIAKLFD